MYFYLHIDRYEKYFYPLCLNIACNTMQYYKNTSVYTECCKTRE